MKVQDRGLVRMGERPPAARDTKGDRVVRAIGWLSLGLGAAELLAPRGLARLAGAGTNGSKAGLERAAGVRELASGAGILSNPHPANWLWARAAGDVMDLALLGSAARAPGARRGRLGAAAMMVLGVAALDVAAAKEESSHRGPPTSIRAAHAVTINRPRAEVYRAWRDFERLPEFMAHLQSVEVVDRGRSVWHAKGPAGRKFTWEAEITEDTPGEHIEWESLPGASVVNYGKVDFYDAPGNRGTEVDVEFRYEPPAGKTGMVLAALFGEEPRFQLDDDLRRFKQVLETGEVLRSDGSPHGADVASIFRQRPARPMGRKEAR